MRRREAPSRMAVSKDETAVSKDTPFDRSRPTLNSYVYMLRCADGSYYVGKTDRPLAERIGDHSVGLGGRYTAARLPVALVWSQDFDRYSDAVAAERQIKGWRRAKKEALIRGEWERLPELAKRGAVLRDEVSRRVATHRSSTSPQDEAGIVEPDKALHPEEGVEEAHRAVSKRPSRRTKRLSRRTPVSKDGRIDGTNPLRGRRSPGPATAFDLTEYLPYLINRTGVELAGAFSREIAHRGVTLQMWRVLAALHHRDGLRISDLAGLTSIDISTLSRLIGKMETRNLVARRRSPEADGRVVTVVVTPAGQAATQAIVPVAQRYETMALAGFTADEAAALKQMLIRVYGNLSGGALDSAA